MPSLPEPATRTSAARPTRPPVIPFALWDGGMSAFSSVILTFVFATYVASAVAATALAT